jgi:1-hydroxycarotenoid 3,4-desaturase
MAVVIIGAGAGGLAAALALSAQGETVTVLEAQSGPGGKMLPVTVDGQSIDSGPTVLTMKWVFDQLFDLVGKTTDEVLQLKKLDVIAKHFWSGGASFELFAERQKTLDAIGQFAGLDAVRGYQAFAAEAHRINNSLRKPFLESQRPSLWRLSQTMPVSDFLRINPYQKLWGALERYFKNPRLRQLFARYATYCGSSPFKTPATLMLVADVESQGVWRVAGGMAALATAMMQCSTAQFHFKKKATRIEAYNHKITAVVDEQGVRHPCEQVIVNADSAAVVAGLFGGDVALSPQALTPQQRSLSAITWCGTMQTPEGKLQHHNVFFSDDYRQEFADLVHDAARDPTVYLCDQGAGRTLVLVNAPAHAQAAPIDSDARMINRLERCGVSLAFDSGKILRRDPKDFAELYPATHGALYGRASHGWMSSFQRPQARTKVPGLYLAGGSTHPGPGVPMAVLSGLRAAEAVLQDRALMRV